VLFKKTKQIFGHNLFWKNRLENYLKNVLKDRDSNFSWSCAYYLILNFENIFNTDQGPILELISKGDDCVEALDILIKLNFNLSVNANEPIKLASDYGLPNIAERLLVDNRVDPSDNYNYAIGMACKMEYGFHRQDYIKVIELLMEDPRVDVSDNDNMALRYALKEGYDDIVQILITDPRVDRFILDKYY
jgi:hypothetical protein